MIVEIDRNSGFCFGVINAIKAVERELKKEDRLYCLGDIVHNGKEVERLEAMGLISISKEKYLTLKDCKVLIRAHGEPPSTYEYARQNNIELIDATCPVVLTLQRKVKEAYKQEQKQNGQLVIFGKKGHAEVIGLNGQTGKNAIIIEDEDDVKQVDFSRPVSLYSQTTRRIEDFNKIAEVVESKMLPQVPVKINDTICRQVSNRVPNLKEFVSRFDLVLFIAGGKSSNGKYLFSICKEANPNSYKVEEVKEIEPGWFNNVNSVGICGATSTPNWLMEQIAEWVKKKFGT
mgnify:CR=1 FL=1